MDPVAWALGILRFRRPRGELKTCATAGCTKRAAGVVYFERVGARRVGRWKGRTGIPLCAPHLEAFRAFRRAGR